MPTKIENEHLLLSTATLIFYNKFYTKLSMYMHKELLIHILTYTIIICIAYKHSSKQFLIIINSFGLKFNELVLKILISFYGTQYCLLQQYL